MVEEMPSFPHAFPIVTRCSEFSRIRDLAGSVEEVELSEGGEFERWVRKSWKSWKMPMAPRDVRERGAGVGVVGSPNASTDFMRGFFSGK